MISAFDSQFAQSKWDFLSTLCVNSFVRSSISSSIYGAMEDPIGDVISGSGAHKGIMNGLWFDLARLFLGHLNQSPTLRGTLFAILFIVQGK